MHATSVSSICAFCDSPVFPPITPNLAKNSILEVVRIPMKSNHKFTMFLAEAIFGTVKQRGDSPCFVTSKDCSNDDGDDAGDTAVTLSYRQAAAALERHAKWLNETIRTVKSHSLPSNSSRNRSKTFVPKDERLVVDESGPVVVLAFLAVNSIDYLLSLLAASSSSSMLSDAPLFLNTRWTVSEMTDALQIQQRPSETLQDHGSTSHHLETTILIYSAEFATTALELVQALSSSHHRVVSFPLPRWGQSMYSFPTYSAIVCSTSAAGPSVRTSPWCRDDPRGDEMDAVIVFTSGTSGQAKGVRLSHRALWVQCRAKLAVPCAYHKGTRLSISTVPLCHVGGLSSFLAVWLAGGVLVDCAPPRSTDLSGHGVLQQSPTLATVAYATSFDPHAVLASVTSLDTVVNTLVVVPTMLYALQQHMHRQAAASIPHDKSFPSVELILIGGQAASPEQRHFVRTTFPNARIVQTYACTEAASSLTFLDVTDAVLARPATPLSRPLDGGDRVGWAPSHVQLCICNAESLPNDSGPAVAQPYTMGIVATRGPHVMNGYWIRNERRSRQTPTSKGESKDQWMRTGDLGYLDDTGCLYLWGRVSDSIRTGGETVIAVQVERVVEQHPMVQECAVFGLGDYKFGEVVCCAIVPKHADTRSQFRNGNDLTIDNLRTWCSQQGLTGYKRPRRLFLLDTHLPRNASGKVLKYELKRQFKSSSSHESMGHIYSKL
jgi:o-succinylbenzoate---CoA ligase